MKEFPNVYTDIACFDYTGNHKNFDIFLRSLAHKNILHKIMFGTDWYMSLVTTLTFNAHRIRDFSECGIMRGRTYDIFIKQWKCFLDSIDPGLWPRFSIINTFNFYDLGNTIFLDNYENGIKGEFEKHKFDDFQRDVLSKKLTSNRKMIEKIPQKIIELKKYYGIKDEQ